MPPAASSCGASRLLPCGRGGGSHDGGDSSNATANSTARSSKSACSCCHCISSSDSSHAPSPPSRPFATACLERGAQLFRPLDRELHPLACAHARDRSASRRAPASSKPVTDDRSMRARGTHFSSARFSPSSCTALLARQLAGDRDVAAGAGRVGRWRACPSRPRPAPSARTARRTASRAGRTRRDRSRAACRSNSASQASGESFVSVIGGNALLEQLARRCDPARWRTAAPRSRARRKARDWPARPRSPCGAVDQSMRLAPRRLVSPSGSTPRQLALAARRPARRARAPTRARFALRGFAGFASAASLTRSSWPGACRKSPLRRQEAGRRDYGATLAATSRAARRVSRGSRREVPVEQLVDHRIDVVGRGSGSRGSTHAPRRRSSGAASAPLVNGTSALGVLTMLAACRLPARASPSRSRTASTQAVRELLLEVVVAAEIAFRSSARCGPSACRRRRLSGNSSRTCGSRPAPRC